MKSHCLGRYNMFHGPTLSSGEHLLVDSFLEGLLAKNKSASWASQGLMGCARNYIRSRDRARVDIGRDQSGEVSHIDEEDRPDFIGNGPEPVS